MRYLKELAFFLLLLVSAPVSAVVTDVQLGIGSSSSSGLLSPGVDQSKLLCLLSRCLYIYSQDFNGYLITYNNSKHVAQFDTAQQLYASASSADGGLCFVDNIYLAPNIYSSVTNLDTPSDCYIWLYVITHYQLAANSYSVNSACFKVNGYSNNLTFEQIEALSIVRVTRPDDWIFPIYLNVTGQGNTNFSSYLTKNCPLSASSCVYYNVPSQQAANALQLDNHFSSAWLIGCVNFSGQGSVSNAWSSIRLRLDNNQVIYADSSKTVVAWGGAPASNGAAGYIELPYPQFNPLTDFDRGGQLDWSEYYREKDMRLASDDNPALDSNIDVNPAGIVAIEPEAIPGESNLDNMTSSEVDDVTSGGFTAVKDEVSYKVTRALDSNEGMASLKALLNPAGFRTDRPLPSFRVSMNTRSSSSSFFGVNLNLPDVVIDFEFLREPPYRDIWVYIRGILNFSLFTMTFLACYGIYEKALAWSV